MLFITESNDIRYLTAVSCCLFIYLELFLAVSGACEKSPLKPPTQLTDTQWSLCLFGYLLQIRLHEVLIGWKIKAHLTSGFKYVILRQWIGVCFSPEEDISTFIGQCAHYFIPSLDIHHFFMMISMEWNEPREWYDWHNCKYSYLLVPYQLSCFLAQYDTHC